MTRFQRLSPTAQGICFMLMAVFLLSVMDVMAKVASERTHPIVAAWARFLGQTLIVAAVLSPKMPGVLRSHYPRLQFLRAAFLMTANTCFFFAITQVGLANATAVMNTNPVLITLGAALFLGERLGLRRALGICAALIGAFMIIRPGADVFTPAALLPLGSAVCVAGYSLATRFVGRSESTWTSLIYTASIGAVVMSLAVPWFWVRPDGVVWLLLAALPLLASAGHLCLIRSFTVAEASAVAPFSYALLLFALFWGAVLFDEPLDGWTISGSIVIVAAGIYVWHRETRAARLARG